MTFDVIAPLIRAVAPRVHATWNDTDAIGACADAIAVHMQLDPGSHSRRPAAR
jgi:hypothetical protein